MALGPFFSDYLCLLGEIPGGYRRGRRLRWIEWGILSKETRWPIYWANECKHPDVHVCSQARGVMILIVKDIMGVRERDIARATVSAVLFLPPGVSGKPKVRSRRSLIE